MWPAIIGGGFNLLGGLFGSSAEKKANQQNYDIAMQNLAWQKDVFNQLMAQAKQQQAEGKLGYTDANGNHVHFEEGKGWVVDLSPQQQVMRELYQGEQEKQMAQDVPLQRERMFENVYRQRDEGGYANSLLDAMQREQLGSSEDVTGIRNLMSAEGINQGYDKTLEEALRGARRTGSSNAGQIAADIGRARGADLRKAFMENQQGAGDEAYNRFATRTGNLAQLYNTFATRASGTPGVQFNPQNIEGQTGSMLESAAGAGGSANANLINSIGQGMNIRNTFTAQPEYGIGNTLSQLGNNLFAAFNQQNQGYTSPYETYAAGGGSSSPFGSWGG